MLKFVTKISVLFSLMFALGMMMPLAAQSDETKWHRRCQGSGFLSCYYCNGTGHNITGFDCRHCDGTGKHKCDRCNGSGVLTSYLKIHKV